MTNISMYAATVAPIDSEMDRVFAMSRDAKTGDDVRRCLARHTRLANVRKSLHAAVYGTESVRVLLARFMACGNG